MATEEGARRTRPSRVQVYVGAVTVLSVAAVGTTWAIEGTPKDLFALSVLTALCFLSQALRSTGVGKTVDQTFGSIIQLASVPALGPVGSAIVGLFAQLLDPRRLPLVVRAYNASMVAVTGLSGGLVYAALGGTTDLRSVGAGHLGVHLGLPLVVADAAQMLTNAIFISAVVRVDTGRPVRLTLREMITSSGLAYLGYGAIAFLFVVLWYPAEVGPFSAVLILAPLFVARWVIVQYAEETRSQESALSGLVTATEIKNPASRGHGGRVAQLAEWMIEPLGLSAVQAQALRFAARLHDVGIVGLPTAVVRRANPTNPADLALLAQHAEVGAQLLADMDFLSSSRTMIRHHHERWDGRGYPDGLTGEDIPLGSRVISVADAFDSLTSDLPGRRPLSAEEALAELERRGGSQLDGRVVAALRRAVERHGWEPLHREEDDLLMLQDYLDHDDPATSDLYATTVHGDAVVSPRPVADATAAHAVES